MSTTNESLKYTGERLVTEVATDDMVYHLHRYALPMDYIKGKVVVDIASGEGYGSNLMAGKAKKVYGVDIAEDAVAFAAQKYKSTANLSFHVGAVESIPLADGIADVVVSFETLEHTEKHEEMMAEIKRILKPGGMLIISSPDKANYTDRFNRINPYHPRELYFDEFKALLNQHFKVSHFYYQAFLTGSVIIKDDYTSAGMTEYSGDYSNINTHKGLYFPLFNIAVSSDESFNEPSSSYFNGEDIMREMYFKRVMGFTPYRLGNAILKPLRVIKSWFKKS